MSPPGTVSRYQNHFTHVRIALIPREVGNLAICGYPSGGCGRVQKITGTPPSGEDCPEPGPHALVPRYEHSPRLRYAVSEAELVLPQHDPESVSQAPELKCAPSVPSHSCPDSLIGDGSMTGRRVLAPFRWSAAPNPSGVLLMLPDAFSSQFPVVVQHAGGGDLLAQRVAALAMALRDPQVTFSGSEIA